MILLWPFVLVLLVVVPTFLGGYIWFQRRRRRFALRYSNLSLVREAVGTGPGIRRHIPPALFLLSLTGMIFAMARPQAVVQVPSFDGTVVLTIDVSGSMRSTDVSPSRIEAAKAAARTFVQEEPNGVRIGVVAFSGSAALVQAPTDDKGAVIAALDRLQPERSTAIGEGMLTAMQALVPSLNVDALDQAAQSMPPGLDPQRSQPPSAPPTPVPPAQGMALTSPGIIVLLSDGQNTTGADPLLVAPQAKALGIRVYTVGVGASPNSAPQGGFGTMRRRRFELDEATLKQIADVTDAQYYNAQTAGDLSAIYHNLVRTFGVRTERTELTAYFTGLAALLAALGVILSMLWLHGLP